MNKLQVGQVVVINDITYMVDHSETFGEELKLIPIMQDPSKEVLTATVELLAIAPVVDYATRLPIY